MNELPASSITLGDTCLFAITEGIPATTMILIAPLKILRKVDSKLCDEANVNLEKEAPRHLLNMK